MVCKSIEQLSHRASRASFVARFFLGLEEEETIRDVFLCVPVQLPFQSAERNTWTFAGPPLSGEIYKQFLNPLLKEDFGWGLATGFLRNIISVYSIRRESGNVHEPYLQHRILKMI